MILSGVVASSAGGFVATGGSQVLTQNGYNYHIFTSSGTFTISSGEKTLSILTINGGSAGSQGSGGGAYGVTYGGNGGAGGNALIGNTTAPVSSSFAVTVGGAGGVSSVTPSRNTTSISGGAGGLGAGANGGGGGTPTKNRDATPGGSVALYNTRGVPWSLLTYNSLANAGNGGGGAVVNQYANSSSAFIMSSDSGTSGYNQSNKFFADDFAVSGPANSGHGGGGGWAYQDLYGTFEYGVFLADAGFGGSGIVIIAYQLG